jgi:uncharacterized membrane protein
MAANWEQYLVKWTNAGLMEPSVADRIRNFEARQEKGRSLNWPILIAISLGGIMLAAGILLFVAAHWDGLSPAQRFAIVLVMVAALHIAGAVISTRFGALATALHALGTICLGAGIFLTGQIFHLQEHWPGGILLWAAGAWAAWFILRDWPQASLAAVLTPAWIAGEWSEATHGMAGSNAVATAGMLLLAINYLTALLPEKTSLYRKALSWIGRLSLIPATVVVVYSGAFHYQHVLPATYFIVGWGVAIVIPLLLAWWLRGKEVWLNILAALWVIVLSMTGSFFHAGYGMSRASFNDLALYPVCALGAVGLIAWGMKEGRKEQVNLGIAGFALTVLFFYFSNVMNKLGRSASLVGFGLLFLLGGWLLEKARRRLLTRMKKV